MDILPQNANHSNYLIYSKIVYLIKKFKKSQRNICYVLKKCIN